MPRQLILVRHGQSQWNLENRFTGWVDVDLTRAGEREARAAGGELARFEVDAAYTSVLKRAIRTLWIMLDAMDRMWLPVTRSWRLNERHYGALQGLDKSETARKYGEEQVRIWRRSYATPPPPLDPDHPAHPRRDRRYAGVGADELPAAESLADTLRRVLPCWTGEIAPRIEAGETVLVAAHGNSLRALIKHLDGLSEEEVMGLDIPTGMPLLYEFDAGLGVRKRGYLGDAEAARAAARAVADQGRIG